VVPDEPNKPHTLMERILAGLPSILEFEESADGLPDDG